MMPWDEQPPAFAAFSSEGNSIKLKPGFGCQHNIKSWLDLKPSGWCGAERGTWGKIPIVAGTGEAVQGEGRSSGTDMLSAYGAHLGSTWWCTWKWWHSNTMEWSHVPAWLHKILHKILSRKAAKMSRKNSHVLQGREDEAVWQLNHHFWLTEKMGKKTQTSQSNVNDRFWC